MASKYEVSYRQEGAANTKVLELGDDADLMDLLIQLITEGFDWLQVKHLYCRHRWQVVNTGQIPGDLVNWWTFRCEKCGEIMSSVLDHELCELHKTRRR